MLVKNRQELNYLFKNGAYDKRINGFKTLYTYKRPSTWKKTTVNPEGIASYTNGEEVVIGFFEEEFGRELSEILYILEAKMAHEAGHINFTNTKIFEEFVADMSYYEGALCHNVFNIVEDGRIEYLMSNVYKALKNKLLFLRIILFYDNIQKEPDKNKLNRILENLLYYATIGVVQDAYRDNLDEEFKELIPYVDEFVTEGNQENSMKIFQKIWEIIRKTFEKEIDQANNDEEKMKKLQELIQKALQNMEDKNLEQEQGSDYNGGDYDGELDKNNSPRISNNEGSGEADSEEDSKKTSQKGSSKEGKENSEDGSGKGSEQEKNQGASNDDTGKTSSGENSEKGSSKKSGKGEGGEEDDSSNDSGGAGNVQATEVPGGSQGGPWEVLGIDQRMNELKGELEESKEREQNSSEELKRRRAEKAYQKNSDEAERKAQKEAGNIATSLLKNSNVVRSEESLTSMFGEYFKEEDYRKDFIPKDLDSDAKSKASALHKELKTVLVNKNMPDVHFQDKGMLDQQNLYQAAIGINDSVFIRRGRNVKSDFAISVLIDSSGSMYGMKMADAVKAASIIEDALIGLEDMALRIVAYSAYDLIYHNLIRDFEDKDTKNYSSSAAKRLEKVAANGNGNCEYINMLYESQMLQKRGESEKILIILSDGLPCGSDGVWDPKAVTAKAVEKVKKDGVEVIPIFFKENNDFIEQELQDYKDMYKENLIHTDSGNIEKQLTKILKTVVNR